MLTWRTSGVLNVAFSAMGAYVAFAYFEFRDAGVLVLPVLGLPDRVQLLSTPTQATALAVAALLAAALGLVTYWLVFRPLRGATPLASLVASLGVLLYLQEVTRLRFPTAGAAAVTRYPVLPDGTVRVLGTGVSVDRLLVAGGVVAVAAVLVVVFRRTHFGLAARAASSDGDAAVLAGVSPDRIGAIGWALSGVLGAAAVVLAEPILGLEATSAGLLVVPALAAALLGGLTSFGLTAAAGLGIGVLQSLLLGWAVRPDTDWIPEWLPTTGLQQAVPVVLILGVLWLRGDPFGAAAAGERRQPSSPEPRHVAAWTILLATACLVAALTVDAPLRQALLVTMIATLLSLSIVVVTGYVGQISLAQLAFAGVAGFVAIELADHRWPFPLAVVAGTALATVVGVVVGLPSLRVRGMSLAVATLAAAVAIEQLVLGSSALSGGLGGRRAPRPYLFGVDVGVAAPGADNFRPAFLVLTLVVVCAVAVVVANLRRNPTGLRWLAVRSNERAAAALGIDVARVKLGAFALSAAIAGLAGCLVAYSTSTLSTTSFLVIGSLVALALTYLGGVASISGAVLAGLLAQAGLLTTLAERGGADSADRYVYALSGLALVVVAIVAPDGLAGWARAVVARTAPSGRRRTGTEPRTATPSTGSTVP